MLSKNEIKGIQSLHQKKVREEERLFIAEGPKIILELVQTVPKQFKKIYALKSWIDKTANALQNIPFEEISEIELGKISQLQAPNEVVGVLHHFECVVPQPKGFILYLDGIQDPGNFGTIIRIADWFGIKDIVCGDGCADVYNAKVVQATMASIARVNIFYEGGSGWLQQQSLPKYAAALNGTSIHHLKKMASGILIIGNESKGIRPEVAGQATEHITIPRIGEAESLNAAVATGIILSHIC